MMMMMTIDMHPTPFFNLSTPDRAAEIESTATEAKHWLADADDVDDHDDHDDHETLLMLMMMTVDLGIDFDLDLILFKVDIIVTIHIKILSWW